MAQKPTTKTRRIQPENASVEPANSNLLTSAEGKQSSIKRATPIVSTLDLAQTQNALLVNKRSGKSTSMSRAIAARWAAKYPGEYDVQ